MDGAACPYDLIAPIDPIDSVDPIDPPIIWFYDPIDGVA